MKSKSTDSTNWKILLHIYLLYAEGFRWFQMRILRRGIDFFPPLGTRPWITAQSYFMHKTDAKQQWSSNYQMVPQWIKDSVINYHLLHQECELLNSTGGTVR